MARSPDPLDVFRTVLDDKLSPDVKSKQIDLMYGIDPTTAMMDEGAASDGRFALGDDRAAIEAAWRDPSLNKPSAGPSRPDVSVPLALPTITTPPKTGFDDSARTIRGQQYLAEKGLGPPTEAPTPIAPKQSPGGEEIAAGGEPAQELTPEQKTNENWKAYLADKARGVPGVNVPEQDLLRQTNVTEGIEVPNAVKLHIAKTAREQEETAIKAGEQAAQAHEAEAKFQDIQAKNLANERAVQSAVFKAQNAHVQQMGDEYKQLVKDTAVNPGTYWTSKDLGHGVLAAIGAFMFGLAHDPQGMKDAIDRGYAQRNLNRDKTLTANRQAIEDFKSRMLSPEAADLADRALATQAAAAEARRLSEAAAAPEARLKGQQAAQILEADLAQKQQQIAQLEADQAHKVYSHVQAHYTGRAGLTKEQQVDDLIKNRHMPPDEAVRAVYGEGPKQESGESPEEGKRRVTFSDGTPGYVANESQQKDTQDVVMALGKYKSALRRIEQLSHSPGHTIGGKDKAAMEADVASAIRTLTAIAKGQGEQARMAGEMLTRLEPLTGSSALKTGVMDETARAQIAEAIRIADEEEEGIKGIVTPTPKATFRGGKLQTLGRSKESLGFTGEK